MSHPLSRRILLGLLLFVLTGTTVFAGRHRGPKHLLVVTVTKGFRHGDSIEVGEKIVADLAAKDKSFVVDYARTDEELAQKMSLEGLKHYDGVFFLNTTGDLPLPDRDGFIKWVEAGHGFIGTHSATDTFHGFPAYLDMIGAEFKTHGAQVEVNCLVVDRKHPATKQLGDSFKVFDEIYQFQRFDRTKFHELFHLDKHPNDGTPGYYPLCWCKKQGKGRVFYTALGHRPDVWQSSWYQAHLLGGIRWALGLEKGDATPQK
jgi:type 1 glutamine amidotransferase